MSEWLEATFNLHRPRALAALTRYFRDIDVAEDAFSDACLKALNAWSTDGAPRDPMGWLLATARNAGLDRVRKAQRQRAIMERHSPEFEPMAEIPLDPNELRDDVLRLLFICCHPALEQRDQIALALKIVAGLSVGEIARGFLVKPKAMEQRITRAKKKVASNPVAFETPSPQERGTRLGEVSAMIYLMFNEGWSASGGETQIKLTLCEEAIRLSRLLVELFPAMGEQIALLSLMLLQHARREARQDNLGRLVPLDQQDRTLWNGQDIAEGAALLEKAQRINHQGPYLIQAAIAFEHARARMASQTNWDAIEANYAALFRLQPTPVIRLNLIATQAKTKGPEHALTALHELSDELSNYRWFHALRGGLLSEVGDHKAALTAYKTVLSLGVTDPEHIVITEKIEMCKKELSRL